MEDEEVQQCYAIELSAATATTPHAYLALDLSITNLHAIDVYKLPLHVRFAMYIIDILENANIEKYIYIY